MEAYTHRIDSSNSHTIPEFDERGVIPPGVHFATWSAVEERFGTNEHRLRLLRGLHSGISELAQVGCRTVYVDGTFVNAKRFPGDFDACWDETGVDVELLFSRRSYLVRFEDKRRAQKAAFGGEFLPAGAVAQDVPHVVKYLEFFQRGKNRRAKGIVAIELIGWRP